MTNGHRHDVARARRRTAACTLALVALAACTARRAAHPEPVPDPAALAWAVTLDSVRAQLASGRASRADTLLTTFRERFVGAAASEDALFWRALARSDVTATPGGVRPAIADLDAYRATPAPAHLAEAVVLRRTLMALDSARNAPVLADRPAVATVAARAGYVPRDSLRVRDEELQRARADAAAAQTELDRIRRRLAAPGRRP